MLRRSQAVAEFGENATITDEPSARSPRPIAATLFGTPASVQGSRLLVSTMPCSAILGSHSAASIAVPRPSVAPRRFLENRFIIVLFPLAKETRCDVGSSACFKSFRMSLGDAFCIPSSAHSIQIQAASTPIGPPLFGCQIDGR